MSEHVIHTDPHPPADATPPPGAWAGLDASRTQLVRIAASKTFQRSARLRDLLLDIGEHTLSGSLGELSEQAIGVRVFGREQGYNPADDNIVRASVRQVRYKLTAYFESEGRNDPVTIEIPKGSYTAAFSTRAEPPPLPERAAGPEARWTRWVQVAAGVGLLAAVVWLATLVGREPSPATIFTSLLRTNADPVRFVLTDSALVIMNHIRPELTTLEEYTNRSHLQKGGAALGPELRDVWDFVSARQITSLADVVILSRLYRENPSLARRIELRYARHMQPREFKSGNFIITGSARSNPWAALFDANLNFQYDFRAERIWNRNPARGEPRFFASRPDGTDYARVALGRNLSGTGFVLLISGLRIEGTEGAGEFLLRSDSLQQMGRALGLADRDPLPACEFVLEIKMVGGTAQSGQIVAARRY